MDQPQVRYTKTSDGVSIACQVEGDGPPVLWAGAQLFESFSVGHLVPRWEALYRTFLSGRTIIRLDPRGVGLSERDVDDVSVEGAYRDIVAVVDAAGFETVGLFCPGRAVPPGVLFAARAP
jgi:pimeloyl-ACP methyl ester carboxylesterase